MNWRPLPSGAWYILKVVSTLLPATPHVKLIMFQMPSLSLPSLPTGVASSFMLPSSVAHLNHKVRIRKHGSHKSTFTIKITTRPLIHNE